MNTRRRNHSRSCGSLILRAAALSLSFLLLATHTSHAECGNPKQPTCAGGSSAGFFLLNVNGKFSCELVFAPGEVTTVRIQMISVPIQKVRLTLPDPPIGIVVGESWGVSHTGERTTGMEVDLGTCTNEGTTDIGEMLVFVPEGLTGCGAWGVNEATAEVQDCEGIWRPAENPFFNSAATYGVTCARCPLSCGVCGLPPYDFYPRDGATNVPLDVTMTWKSDPFPSLPRCSVVFTNSACEDINQFMVPCNECPTPSCDGPTDQSFSPNFLQPGTTYYWRAEWGAFGDGGCNSGFYGIGPLHSFTTEPVTATEPVTWGKVKALYRR